MFRLRSLSLGLILLMPIVLLGCGDPQAATNFVRERVVNALVGSPNLDIALSNHVPTVTNLAFDGVSPYVTSGTLGTTTVTAVQTGTTTQVASPTQVFLATGQSNTIVVSGVAGGTGALAPRIYRLVDNAPPASFTSATSSTTTGSATTTFAIRVYNLSPDSKPINLQFAGAGTQPPVVADTSVIPGLADVAYGNVSDYVVVTVPAPPPAVVTLTINDNASTKLLATPTLANFHQVLNGELLTVYVTGMENPAAGQQALDANVTQDSLPATTGTSSGTTGTSSSQ